MLSVNGPMLERQRIGMESDVANDTGKLRRTNDSVTP